MQTGLIDTHAHLIPNVDDGCASVADAIACARRLVAAGYTHAFCTPHVWPSLPRNTPAAIGKWVADLRREFADADVPLEIFPGGEIALFDAWPQLRRWSREQIVTYSLAGKYVLFDFWDGELDEIVDDLEAAMRHFHTLRLTPILAHPERIGAFHGGDSRAATRVQEMGVLLQMNTWCLTERPGSAIYETAARLLSEDRYFMFGTDCHNSKSLEKRIQGLEIARQLVGAESVERMTMANPQKLLPADWVESR